MRDLWQFVPKIIRTNFSRQLLVLFSVVVLFIGAIGGLAYVETGSAIDENTETNIEQTAELQAQALGSWSQGLDSQVTSLAGDLTPVDNGTAGESHDLDGGLDGIADEHVVGLYVLDETATITDGTASVEGESLTGTGIPESDIATIPEGQTVALGPYHDPAHGPNKLAVSTQIPDADDYLVAVVDLESKTDQLEDHLRTEGAFTVVYDADARTLMNHHHDRIGSIDRGHDGAHERMIERAIAGETAVVEMVDDDGHADGHADDHADDHDDGHADDHDDGHADDHADDHDDGHADDHADDHDDGHDDGHADDHDDGHADDHDDGHDDGHADDHDDGHADDHDDGHADDHDTVHDFLSNDHDGNDPDTVHNYLSNDYDGSDHDDSGGSHAHHGDLVMGYTAVDGASWFGESADGGGWAVMIHVPVDDAYALQTQIGRMMLALVAVSLVGLGAIGLVVGRTTSQSLNRLAGKAAELEDGNLDTDLQTARDDEIGQLYRSFASMRDSLRESFQEVESARREAVHEREKVERLATQLEAEAGEVMARAAQGDLTARITFDGDHPALEQVACEYNEMMDDIEDMTAQLKRFAVTVAAHSEEVTASAEEVQSAGENVSMSVQDISSKTTRQDDKLQVIADSINDISATTEEIASLANQVAEIADQTTDAGAVGRRATAEAIRAMDAVDDESEATVAVMRELETEIGRVEDIAGIIGEFSDQMNMLAMNANIEASRSVSDANNGFAAVAREVRELSEDSKEAAERIERIIDDVLDRMGSATTEVTETRSEIDEAQLRIKRAGRAHQKVATFAEQTAHGVSEISAATEEQTASTQEIVSMVDETARLGSGVAKDAETVAAAAQQQSAALSEVTESAKDLTQEADELRGSLDRFTLSLSEVSPNTPTSHGSNEAIPRPPARKREQYQD